MQQLSIWHRILKTAALMVISIGICLHVVLQYDNLFAALVVIAAVGVINAIVTYVLWLHPAPRQQPVILHSML